MVPNEKRFKLPRQVEAFLSLLNRLYEQREKDLHRQIVVNGEVSIEEQYEYDGWNGGVSGHAVTLRIPEDLFVRIIDTKSVIETDIAEDLNNLHSVDEEYFHSVKLEVVFASTDDWRRQTGIYKPRRDIPTVSEEALDRIWGDLPVRVFLSHKSSVKKQVADLKNSLARCGIAAFVAHEDIEPTEAWQGEIERALFSMDALVGLLTDDFHDSYWTDQEFGVAIGRGVVRIAVRLGMDPYGLMGKGQALRGCSFNNTNDLAVKVFQLLYKRLPERQRIFECAISAYAASTSWSDSGWKAKNLLSHFEQLDSDQVSRVLKAYLSNDENKYSFDGKGELKSLLERWTGKQWIIRNNILQLSDPVEDPVADDIPF